VIRSAFFVLPFVIAFSQPSFGDCTSLAKTIQDASRSGDLATIAEQAERIAIEPSCPDAYRPKLSRMAAYAYLRVANERLQSGATLADQRDLLLQSLDFAQTWQALAMLGDIEHQQKRFEGASLHYQNALSVINDPVATEAEPPAQVIETIHRKAAEARMLADRYVSTPVNHRSGAAEGLALTSVRSFTVKRVPLPVTFESGSTRFTPKGTEAAEDLAATLLQRAPSSISIIGHTDDRGTAAHNQRLSKLRAEALANFLRSR
jgi:outer membrane protein OmpA-like peptidoglycan-associated protein